MQVLGNLTVIGMWIVNRTLEIGIISTIYTYEVSDSLKVLSHSKIQIKVTLVPISFKTCAIPNPCLTRTAVYV